jgi:HEPN domain-containing protein
MSKDPREWLRQAEYDLDTAEYMHRGGRYFYAVFMRHLAVEKVLNWLYQERLGEIPPKTHNLIYLAEKIELHVPGPLYDTLFLLNRVKVPRIMHCIIRGTFCADVAEAHDAIRPCKNA